MRVTAVAAAMALVTLISGAPVAWINDRGDVDEASPAYFSIAYHVNDKSPEYLPEAYTRAKDGEKRNADEVSPAYLETAYTRAKDGEKRNADEVSPAYLETAYTRAKGGKKRNADEQYVRSTDEPYPMYQPRQYEFTEEKRSI